MSPEPEVPEVVEVREWGRKDPVRKVHLCPRCGWPVAVGWTAGLDPGDVEPSGICTKPSCDFFY